MGEFVAILVVACAVALAVLKDRVVGIIAVSALSKIRADSAVRRARRRALLTKRGWLFFITLKLCVKELEHLLELQPGNHPVLRKLCAIPFKADSTQY